MSRASSSGATTIPILSNVLLRAEAGPAGLERHRHGSRDRRAGAARDRARRAHHRAGAHALRHRAQIARRRPDRDRSAAARRNEMVLRSGRSTFTLACLPPEDYPVMSAGELPHHFALTAAELRTLIDRTRFAISTEETRYYLNGIYLHATKSNEVPVDPRRGDRRPPPGPVRDGRARGRRRHAGHHRSAQDGAGTAQAGRGGRGARSRSRSARPRSASRSARPR